MARAVMIFHIVGHDDWMAASVSGIYHPASLDNEGFIHCSTAGQVRGVLSRFYADVPDLVVLVIDTESLGVPILFEQADDQSFPHIYGELPVDAVIDAGGLERDAQGELVGEWEFWELNGNVSLEQAIR
jgi:uncharacterized protein (DUF952 family)